MELSTKTPDVSRIRIGPAGWDYEDWKGVVYPRPRPRGFRPLPYLARFFSMVEVNSTFYRIPGSKMSENWVAQVEPFPDFLFTVKLWEGFTHARDSIEPLLLNQWHAGLEPLRRAGRLGCVLVQFPWSFKRERAHVEYLETLTRALAPDPLTIEVRHDSWLDDEFLAWLREHGYAFCNIDQPQLNHCLPPTENATAPFAYVRLHGRNTESWFAEDADVVERYKYLYSKQEMGDWVERLKRLIEKAEKVFVVTNNHAEGRAVANGLQLKSMLTEKKVEAPATLVRSYPELAEFSRTPPAEPEQGPDAEQLSLF